MRRATLCALIALLAALTGCQRTSTRAPEPVPPVAAAAEQAPTEASPYRHVDRANLEEFAKFLAESHWWPDLRRVNSDDLHIESIDLVEQRQEHDTLVPGQTVHLILAHVDDGWWKLSTDYVMVLQPTYLGSTDTEPYAYETLLVAKGAWGGRETRYEVMDLGVDAPRFALVVRVLTQAMCLEEWETSVYLNDDQPRHRQMREVFGEMTHDWHPEWGDARYTDSEVTFRDCDRKLKDIVISAHVEKWHGRPDASAEDWRAETEDYYKVIDERRTWVFRWDGERYVGEIDLSE